MPNILRLFQKVTSDQTISFESKVNTLLKLGLETFSLDVAIVSKIDGDRYQIKYVESGDESLTAGTVFDLSSTYCTHTISANGPVHFHQAGKSHIANHPCYRQLKIESYIGAPIRLGSEIFGTLNFSSLVPRAPFEDKDADYVELFAQWMGTEILRQREVTSLKQSNQMLLQLEKVAKVGSWSLDLKTNELYWSEQTRLIHEVDESFVPDIDGALAFYCEGESRNTISDAISNTIVNKAPWDMRLELITAKGRKIWVSTHGGGDFEGDTCVRLYGTFEDVTEETLLQQELRAQRELAEIRLSERGKLLSKISHELRTPLNGIIGMLRAAEQTTSEPLRKERMAYAQASADLLMALINEVLDFSKIEQGALTFQLADIRLKPVFVNVIEMYRQLCREKGIELVTKLDISESLWVSADTTRISQIIQNLLNNAVKFTQIGHVTINVSCVEENNKALVRIGIIDSGIGMSPEVLTTLFEPFNQGDERITLQYGGTGLGLSIVKELVDMMSGEIKVSSKVNVGSTFEVIVSLPIVIPHDTKDAIVEGKRCFRGLQALVVDDNEINRLVMAAALEELSVDVDFAVDGQDAIKKCLSEEYSVIFMDCLMPKMDGIEATKQLRRKKIVKADTLIVALTASTSEADKRNCMEAGMNLYMAKPVNIDELKQALNIATQNNDA